MSQATQRELQPSDEINQEQIELAKRQGETFQQALDHMIRKEAQGQRTVAGDYIIAFANEKAEGMYRLRDGALEWQEPEQENTHLEVAVCDVADGRLIPGLTVFATLVDDQGRELGTHQQPFLWHPWLFHYGRNWTVPNEGPYTLRIRVEAPHWARHDKINGKRFAEPVEVTFTNVTLELGQK